MNEIGEEIVTEAGEENPGVVCPVLRQAEAFLKGSLFLESWKILKMGGSSLLVY